MSSKAIYEATGKDLLNRFLCSDAIVKIQIAVIDEKSDWQKVVDENPWLLKQKLVVKPDQLIKRRGKLGLIKVNTDLSGVRAWIEECMNKVVKVDKSIGKLHRFIIEPFVPHAQEEEACVCIYSHRYADTIVFHHEGGVDIGEVDAKALKLDVLINRKPSFDDVKEKLVTNLPAEKQDYVAAFICTLYDVYVDLYFTYLQINPLVLSNGKAYILDLAAKLDARADFVSKEIWGNFEFPPAFGRDDYPEIESKVLEPKSAEITINSMLSVQDNIDHLKVEYAKHQIQLQDLVNKLSEQATGFRESFEVKSKELDASNAELAALKIRLRESEDNINIMQSENTELLSQINAKDERIRLLMEEANASTVQTATDEEDGASENTYEAESLIINLNLPVVDDSSSDEDDERRPPIDQQVFESLCVLREADEFTINSYLIGIYPGYPVRRNRWRIRDALEDGVEDGVYFTDGQFFYLN